MLKSTFLTMILTAFIASQSSAATIDWENAGLNESEILNPGGQLINDFAGINGLNVVITGSANLRSPSSYSIAPFTHVDGNLYLATEQVANDVDPISITFSFNKNVSIFAGMQYFGDAGIQEEFRWSSNTGIFDATVNGDNAIIDDLTSLVRITSGSNSVSDLAQITTTSVKDVTIALGGAGFTGLAGTTVSMDLEIAAVPLPPSVWLFGSGLLSLMIGSARQKRN